MKSRLKLVLVDFDGVVSNGRFYRSEDETKKQLGKSAAECVFASENLALVHSWMRGELTYREVHDIIGGDIGIDPRLLDDILEKSIEYMPMNKTLLQFVESLRKNGVIVSLFTDNMDIFDSISIRYHELDKQFDHIYSSSKHGQLKFENNMLLQKALDEAGVLLEQAALVDDSPKSYKKAESFGLATFLYKDYDKSQAEFEHWLRKYFTW